MAYQKGHCHPATNNDIVIIIIKYITQINIFDK